MHEIPRTLTTDERMNSLKAQDIFSLKGRRALITGASRGIAAAIAETLATNGAVVGINYSAGADAAAGLAGAAEAVERRIAAFGGTAHLLEEDMLQPGAASRLVARMEDAFGGCDILVVSASMQVHRSFLDMSLEDTLRQLQLNFLSTVELLQALLPMMKARGYGRVLTIGSVQEAAPSPEMPIYAATKAAQVNLVRTLAVEFAPFGITLNNLAPGLVQTDRNAFRRLDPQHWAENVRLANPMGRAGLPEEMVGAALYLCSDAAAFVTGATLFVTGGGHIPQPGYDTAPATTQQAAG
ncbi:short-chain dehydrogenase [Devosia nitrariae]|uniref:Short-chain dehydrogenase n=2 Tax=Devosia nitrariae TaxID=2071872 RepID=A0ABQ5W8G0_9HYPH|nr:short-chain dehydrogenase [Devosia nitrariae]